MNAGIRKSLALAILALSCAAPKVAPAPASAEAAPLIARSREAARGFGAALKSELEAAMERSGPAAAVEVCSVEAPRVAERQRAETGFEVSRVSLRHRNPANAARGWTVPVLEGFEARLARGEPADRLEHHEFAEEGGRRVFRYMRAIPTQSLCLGCHGTDLDPEVAARIRARYPEDRATGFRAGELRGAFVVVQPL